MHRSPAWRLSCAGLSAALVVSASQAQVAAPPQALTAQLEKLRAQLDEQRVLIERLSAELEQVRGAGEEALAQERGAGQAGTGTGAAPASAQVPAAQESRSAPPPARPAVAQKDQPVGQPPRKDTRPPEVAPLFEQPGILTQQGKYILEPSLQYGYASNNRVALVGYTIIPALLIGLIDVREVKRNTMTGSLALRTGVSNRTEVEIRAPYVYRSDSTVSRELFTGTALERVFATSGRGLGDIEIAARHQLNDGGADKAYYLAGWRFKSRTGRDPFEVVTDCQTRCLGQNATGTGLPLDLPTGSGFYSMQPSVTWLFPSDPAIFFGTVSYTHNFKRADVSRTVLNGEKERLGKLAPGGVVGFNFGMGLALNDKASVSIGYDHSSVGRMKQNGLTVPGSVRTQLGTLLVAYSYRLSDKRSLNVSVGAGVTRDTPDVSLTVRLPTTF
ncbi:acetate kinase [Massilia cavernae]|uniref:Acetate kinase n=1 Tax=Massilia cavernae TaxID=2320864 RepID=A0A418XRI9_9BURK|nr:acetate kinase [Massilia cavernae]RJG15077.1 acetate kinase [Massilia cavernae]